MRAAGRGTALAVAALSALALAAAPTASAFGPITAFAPYGSEASQTSLTIGMVVGPDGVVYATDFQNHRVNAFTAGGVFVRSFGKGVNPAGGDVCTAATKCQKGTKDSAPGAMYAPTGIAIDAAGTVFVADTGNNRIDVFTSTGTFLRAFGKGVNPSGGDVCTVATGCQVGGSDSSAGAVWAPTGVDIDASGTVFAANNGAFRIDAFTAAGAFVRAFGKDVNPLGGDVCTAATGCQRGQEAESAGAIFGPFDVAVDGGGRIAVSDLSNNRVDVFSPAGTFLHAFGKGVNPAGGDVCDAASGCKSGVEGGMAGGLAYPTGIAADAAGNLVVADLNNHRINEFTFAGAFIRAFGQGVADGAPDFQICTSETGCTRGTVSYELGAVSNPYATAVDCAGAIYAGIYAVGEELNQVERFGEPLTKSPPCPEPAATTPRQVAQPAPSLTAERRFALPKITIEVHRRSGTATLLAVVSGSGKLLLSGKRIRKAQRDVGRPGLAELTIAPRKKVKRRLRRTGKVKVRAALTFVPRQGEASTQVEPVQLRLTRRGCRSRRGGSRGKKKSVKASAARTARRGRRCRRRRR